MKNYINISISAKDYENGDLLIILNKFNNGSIYLTLFNQDLNKLVDDKEIKNQHLLNIINAFLAEAKEDEYNLKDSGYSEFYRNFVNSIFCYISSAYCSISWRYDEITLKVSKW